MIPCNCGLEKAEALMFFHHLHGFPGPFPGSALCSPEGGAGIDAGPWLHNLDT